MIRIDNDYVIDVDQYNYTLMIDKHKMTEPKKEDEQPKPIYKTIGYYKNLKQAIQGLLRYLATDKLEHDTFTLEEALIEINKINNRFEELLERVINETEV